MARMDTPKAMSRAKERKIRRRSRWWAGRAAPCGGRWSTGTWRTTAGRRGGRRWRGAGSRARSPRMGEMIRRCTATPRRAPSPIDAMPASQIGQPVAGHQEVDPVHAQHDEVHVHDPDDVEHAEDQVQPEREQREHAAEQDAVQRGLEEEDGVDHAVDSLGLRRWTRRMALDGQGLRSFPLHFHVRDPPRLDRGCPLGLFPRHFAYTFGSPLARLTGPHTPCGRSPARRGRRRGPPS